MIMKIDQREIGPPLNHAWKRCFGQGRAAELLRHDVLDHLAILKAEVGFEYLRFHGLFHDELSVVTRRSDGRLCFHWLMVEKVFDAMMRLGIRPFVELGPMPLALASGEQTCFRWEMNVTPPVDYSEWGDLIESFATHFVRRYGLDVVKTWYFEVWNEPNLAGFWTGTFADYGELYSHAARALKRVHNGLRVGGPATAQARWIPEFIAYCQMNEVPLDFVSTHSYLQDEHAFYPGREGSPSEPADYLLDQFRRVKKEVAASPRPDLEIHWTEWNSLSADHNGVISWTENRSVDTLYAGSFALHQAVRADGLCNSQSWWVVTDIFGEDGIAPLAYSQTYGLLNPLGIPKASFHAFKWLSRMRGERLTVSGIPDQSAHQVLVTKEEAVVRALIWNHPPVEKAEGEWAGQLEAQFDALMLLTSARLTAKAGGGFEQWEAWGSPPNLTSAQVDALRYMATPAHEVSLCAAGLATVEFVLQPYEVLFLEWVPAEASAEGRGVYRAGDSSLETNLADLTREAL